MESVPVTEGASTDHPPRPEEPIGRLTPYGSTLADVVAVVQLAQQAWTGALILAGIAGGLAVTHLVRRRGRPLGRSGLGVVAVAAVSFALVGTSAAMLIGTTPAAPATTPPPTTVTVTAPPATAPPAASSQTTVTSAPGDTAPPPAYTDKELVVPRPDSSLEIDFDKPVVSTSSLATGADVDYSRVNGVDVSGNARIGAGPAERPSDPEVCVDAAQTRPIKDNTEPETIEVGMAFCVITDRGNIVWFTVTARTPDKYSPGFTFRTTMWSR